jgi:hypothetical protein
LYHPNAAGLPPLALMADWRIEKNNIHDNNEINMAPIGSMSAGLPSGIGVLVLGVDHATVKKNTVTGNDFIGIGVVDYCVGVDNTPFDCDTNPPIVEPAPDDTLVAKNELSGNGGNPPGGIFASFAGDLALLAPLGTGNCFEDNSSEDAPIFVGPVQCM